MLHPDPYEIDVVPSKTDTNEDAPGHAAGTAFVTEGEQRNPTLKKENHR